jgi:hypothetical protein
MTGEIPYWGSSARRERRIELKQAVAALFAVMNVYAGAKRNYAAGPDWFTRASDGSLVLWPSSVLVKGALICLPPRSRFTSIFR